MNAKPERLYTPKEIQEATGLSARGLSLLIERLGITPATSKRKGRYTFRWFDEAAVETLRRNAKPRKRNAGGPKVCGLPNKREDKQSRLVMARQDIQERKDIVVSAVGMFIRNEISKTNFYNVYVLYRDAVRKLNDAETNCPPTQGQEK